MPASVPSTPAAWHWRPGAFLPSIRPASQRRLRILALAVAVLFALYAMAGFLGVPWLAKRQIESIPATQIGRHATVDAVRFNPFTLQAQISGFALADREPGRTLLAFELLDLNLSIDSIWNRALTVQEARLVRPQLRLALDASGESNIRDLVERAAAAPSGTSEPRFVVHNLEVEDGTLVFEDALRGHRTEVTRLAMGIPFLSGRASDASIRVKPHLEGIIDGAPFAFQGTTSSPFQDVQQATLAIDLDALSLPRYAEYAPLPNGLQLTDGALTTRLSLAFITWKGKPRGIGLSGYARLDHGMVARRDGSELAAIQLADMQLRRLDPLARSVAFDRITVTAPRLDLRRLADGSLELPALLTPAPAAARPEPAPEGEAARAWEWSVDVVQLARGDVRVLDHSVAPAFETRLTALSVDGAKIASKGEPGTVDIAFDTDRGAHFTAHASLDVAGLATQGHGALTGLALAPLHPYYDGVLALDVRSGAVDANADFEAAAGTPQRLVLRGGAIALNGLDAAVRGEREPLVRIAKADARDVTLDLAARKLTIGAIAASDGSLRVLREADGRMHFERALKAAQPWRAGAAARAAAEAKWQVVVQRLGAERFAADVEDRAVQPAVKLRIVEARLDAENLDTAPGATANVELATRIGTRGRLEVRGSASAEPLAFDGRIDATGVDLVPLRAYAESGTNIVITRGTVTARGRLTYGGGGAPSPNLRYAGNVIVSNFASLDRPGEQDLMRWKTLAVTDADVNAAPFRASLGAVALDRFYARLVLGADAKLNVLQLLAPTVAAEPAAPTEAAPPAKPAADAREIPVAIGRVQLTNGEVEFSDFFVKPNYAVHLTDVNGTLSRLAAKQAGTVEVAARVDGAAPVDIRGTVNPFAKQLALDITGKASGVDLPPLSPYAVKYAGYGIEKGKLSMEVQYRVENRKLAASNKLVLDQLTFGDRVESPTATKLPVLLLVSLLKDRDGVIKLDLPISGTLDDPKFSMWRIVVQIIGNLLAKAATAPFALLGAIVGGGEQLAYVEFDPGLATLTPASEAKLATLSKALVDRPSIRIDAAGRAIPDVDTEGLRRAALERSLRLAKQKDLARAGEAAPALEEIAIESAERDKYLKAVYGDTKLANKPRNLIGIAKDIPATEMEKLLLAGYPVDENALRALADHRAQAVKEWLTTKGNVPAERVFVAAPKIGTEGLKGEGAPTRVDFAMK